MPRRFGERMKFIENIVIIKDGVKLPMHSQPASAQPLKFSNG